MSRRKRGKKERRGGETKTRNKIYPHLIVERRCLSVNLASQRLSLLA